MPGPAWRLDRLRPSDQSCHPCTADRTASTSARSRLRQTRRSWRDPWSSCWPLPQVLCGFLIRGIDIQNQTRVAPSIRRVVDALLEQHLDVRLQADDGLQTRKVVGLRRESRLTVGTDDVAAFV